MTVKKFEVYEYPLKDGSGKTYYGSYTVKAGTKPLGFKGEKKVDSFSTEVLDEGEVSVLKANEIFKFGVEEKGQ